MLKPERAQHRYEELPVSAYETHRQNCYQTIAISKRSAGTFSTFSCSCMSAEKKAESEKTSAAAGILSAVFGESTEGGGEAPDPDILEVAVVRFSNRKCLML